MDKLLLSAVDTLNAKRRFRGGSKPFPGTESLFATENSREGIPMVTPDFQIELAEKADHELPCFPDKGLKIDVGDGWVVLGDECNREYAKATRFFARQVVRVFRRGRRWILRAYKVPKDPSVAWSRRSWSLCEGNHLLFYSSGELSCRKQQFAEAVKLPDFPRGGMELVIGGKQLSATWERHHANTSRELARSFARLDLRVWRKKRKRWRIDVTPRTGSSGQSQALRLGNGRYLLTEVDGKIRCQKLPSTPSEGEHRLFRRITRNSPKKSPYIRAKQGPVSHKLHVA